MNERTAIPLKAYAALLAQYIRPQIGTFALLVILVLTGIGFQLVNPLIVRSFLDAAESRAPLNELFGSAALFIGVALVTQAVMLAATYTSENVAWTATNMLRADLALHCLKLDMSFHKKYKPGELIERVDGDVNQLANFFSQLLVQLTGNLLLIGGVVILLALLDLRLGLAMAAIAAAGLFIVNYLNRRAVPRWERLREAEAQLFGDIEEWLNGTEEIASSGAAPYIMRRLYQGMRQRWLRVLGAIRIQVWVITLPFPVFALCYVAAHIIGSSLFLAGTITIGTLYLVFYYIDVVKGPIWNILDQVQELQRASASIVRISELRAIQPTIHDGPGVAFPRGPLSVAFEDVTFHYEDDETANVLQNITFKLEPGKVLGLLGRTGSGKSTLTKLLFRFYDPSTGVIRLGSGDGCCDLREARQAELRDRIGMVTQDVQIFRASVRQNLTLFDESVPDERIHAVVAEVGLDGWLNRLPDGLDTVLEAGGGGLSAGEGQLLAFARIFLADPGVVVLDEASSRLDPATEARIEHAVDRLLRNRTGIIIAHRLGTVQRADEIMILEDGRIAEHDQRARLAADRSSRFYRLLQTGLEEVMA
jgi:ATP-binding cassette, subfamily B, bacterial